MSAPTRPSPESVDTAEVVDRTVTDPPTGPLTSAELEAAVPRRHPDRGRYHRIWHGMYRHEDQPDDLWLRGRALARTWPEGVLRGRSAALLWGDDSAPADAPPEIWLPSTRKSAPGRVYRYGRMPGAAVTEVDGVRVTTPLRTCRDLAADLPREDAVVAVDRMCAADPGLRGLLAAAVEHPSGRGARVLAPVLRHVDPRSGCAEASRVRLVLAAHRAAGTGFAHGHEIRLGRRDLRPVLADPAARCVVEPRTRPRSDDERARDERTWAALRMAGWTVLVVRGRDRAAGGPPGVPGSFAGPGPCADPAPHAGTVGRALAALRSRWPDTELVPPFADAAAADPHGMWAGPTR